MKTKNIYTTKSAGSSPCTSEAHQRANGIFGETTYRKKCGNIVRDVQKILDSIIAGVNVQEWEAQLDQLGPFASHDALAAHLDRAPAGSPTKDYLAAYLANSGNQKHC